MTAPDLQAALETVREALEQSPRSILNREPEIVLALIEQRLGELERERDEALERLRMTDEDWARYFDAVKLQARIEALERVVEAARKELDHPAPFTDDEKALAAALAALDGKESE